MMEEAADFEDGKDYRGYVEAFYGLPKEVEGFTNEQIDAWFEEFVQKAKKAVNTTEQAESENSDGRPAPADLDREFIEIIRDPGDKKDFKNLKDFVEMAAISYNENYDHWQAVDEEDAAKREHQMEITDMLYRKLSHPTWVSIFKANGEMGPIQQKQLLTLIQRAPRDYRAIYAEVMDREDMAVSAEDTTAAALKYRITDSRKEDIDSLTPEKLRQLAEQIDIEEFAKTVKSGKAKFNDPIEKAYIKQLQDQLKAVENTLKEVESDRQEDNNYIERIAGKQLKETFDRALKAREEMTRRSSKLDRAVATGRRDIDRIARQAQRANANYQSIVNNLEEIARAQNLELNVREALTNQRVQNAVKEAREVMKSEAERRVTAQAAIDDARRTAEVGETKAKWERKVNDLQEEYKDFRKSAKTEATLTVLLAKKSARAELRAYLSELNERRETAKELTKARKGVVKRILRPINQREVNADQGRAIAIIQRLVEPSMLEGIDRFIGGIEKPYLRTIFETWETDELLRHGILKKHKKASREKMDRLLFKDSFDELTKEEKKYLYRKILPKDWATALGLYDIIARRNENYPALNGEAEMQIAFKYLPPDVYYRIMDTPFSEWTFEEVEELAKIIDNLTIQGKEIRKANIDAEKRRIREYQNAVRKTILTVTKDKLQIRPNDTPEEKKRKTAEVEKILGKYHEGVIGTAQAYSRRRNFKGPLFGYGDMDIYRFARMLDNGDTNGKNTAALYRRTTDAFNQEMAAVDARTERIQKAMRDLGITEKDLWEKTVNINLGGDLGETTFTADELIGFLSAIRDDYSHNAVLYGDLLSEKERGLYQYEGITRSELAPMLALADGRFDQVKAAADKLMADNPTYQKFLDAIDEDFTEGGQRLTDSLVRYNNTWMPIVQKYFPIIRQAPVGIQSADAQKQRALLGASSGAFNFFVEKGFTEKRKDIPPAIPNSH
jgi:hypothetical protein